MLYEKPISILDNVRAGLDRPIPEWLEMGKGLVLNLGEGKKPIEGALGLDASSGWLAPDLNFSDESVSGIYAYHFLEHLDKNTLISLLRECQRVLIPGGLMNIAVPWAKAQIAFQDLDHKSFWTERTFKTLFENEHYQGASIYEKPLPDNGWKLKAGSVFLMGLIERNIMVFAQLEKTK